MTDDTTSTDNPTATDQTATDQTDAEQAPDDATPEVDTHATDSADCDRSSLLAGLDEHTTPLATTDPMASLDDPGLAALGDAVADARIVGLGEATHGSREFFRLKHRFLRYLVETQGVRAFALEANMPETRALNSYVVGS